MDPGSNISTIEFNTTVALLYTKFINIIVGSEIAINLLIVREQRRDAPFRSVAYDKRRFFSNRKRQL
jgi:hypothetical protein